MDSFENNSNNIFSTTTLFDDQYNWLLPLQQQQQQHTSDDYNYETFDFQNVTPLSVPIIDYNSISNFTDPEIKEQILLLQQQKQQQQNQIQQHLQNYQQQQEQIYQQRQQLLYHQSPEQLPNQLQPQLQQPLQPLQHPTFEQHSQINYYNQIQLQQQPPLQPTTKTTILYNNYTTPPPQTTIANNDYVTTPQTSTILDQYTISSMKTMPYNLDMQIANQTYMPSFSTDKFTTNNNLNIYTGSDPNINGFNNNTRTTKITDDNKSNKLKITNKIQPDSKAENRSYRIEACKKHREKKKDYIKDIEDKIAALTFENQQLIKENNGIKTNGESIEAMKPVIEFADFFNDSEEITKKMKKAIHDNDERALIYLLHHYHIILSKFNTVFENDTEKLIHPNTLLILANSNYIPHADPLIYDILSGPGSDDWIDQFKQEAELTFDQSIKFDGLRIKFNKLDQKFLKERLDIDAEVKKFYFDHIMTLHSNPLLVVGDNNQPYISDLSQSPLLNPTPLKLSQVLEFIKKLETLRNKIIIGRVLMYDIFASLSSILTPKQEAMFYIRIHIIMNYYPSRVDMLNDVWTNIMSPNRFSKALDLADALEKMINNNGNNNNNNNITAFPTLQPATFIPPHNK